MKTDVIFIILSLCLFYACSSDPESLDQGDSDSIESETPVTDGDEERVEAEMTDGDSSDGDIDRVDGDSPDAQDTEREADTTEQDPDATDGDLDGEGIDRDAEEDPETEADSGIQVQAEDFPFATTTVTPCSNKLKSSNPNAVWGDDMGKVYFAGIATDWIGEAPFWVYDANTDTFTCDPMVTETLYAVDGRLVDGEPEIWVGAADKIGRLYQGGWTWVDIPESETISSEGTSLFGLRVNINGVVAIWGDLGLAFYNSTIQTWVKSEFCADISFLPLQIFGELFGYWISGYWIEDLFYLPIGCSIYRINPSAPACDVLAVLEGCEFGESSEDPFLHATGAIGETLWLAYSTSSLNEGIRELYTVDVKGDATFEALGFNTDHCSDVWGDESAQRRSFYRTSISSGMAGTPILFSVSIYSQGMPFCGSNVSIKPFSGSTNISCDLAKPLYIPSYVNCNFPVFYYTRMWRSQNDSVWTIIPKASEIFLITWDMPQGK